MYWNYSKQLNYIPQPMARQDFQQQVRTFFKETQYLVTSRMFLKNFGGMLAMIVGFIVLAFLFIRLFTRHNSHVTVPTLMGKTMEQVEKLKGIRKFDVVVMDEMEYNDELEPGEIVIQEPKPEAKAKKGRRVYVTINPYEKPMRAVPRIWDLQLERAKTKLERKKFKYKISYRADKATNTVLEVLYKGKTVEKYDDPLDAPKVPYGSELELVVAKGAGPAVGVPNLVCMTYAEAKSTLATLELNIGSMMVLGNVSDTLSAYVWQQRPSAFSGMTINIGEEINIWLQGTEPAGCDDSWDDIDIDVDDGDYQDDPIIIQDDESTEDDNNEF